MAAATLTKGIQVTAHGQIEVLTKINCEEAIQEIIANGRLPLSADRLNHHIDIAIETGFVARVEGLIAIGGAALNGSQTNRLVKVCLRLEWIPDALSASKLGIVSEETREELIKALCSGQFAENREEAVQLLDGKE